MSCSRARSATLLQATQAQYVSADSMQLGIKSDRQKLQRREGGESEMWLLFHNTPRLVSVDTTIWQAMWNICAIHTT
ncbi:hypothetical protein FKM82_020918 [Ascaphus truei]